MRYLLMVLFVISLAACDTNNEPEPTPEPVPIPEPVPDPVPNPEPNPNPDPEPEPEPEAPSDEPNGTLDTTFGTEGKVILDRAPLESATDTALQKNGTLVVVGRREDEISEISGGDGGFITLLNPDGTVKRDTFFLAETPEAVVLTPEDDIIIVGKANDVLGKKPVYLRGLKSDGSPDSSFGENGFLFVLSSGLSFDIRDALLDSKGRIVIGGNIPSLLHPSTTALQLVRFLPDGSLDTTFNKIGSVETQLGSSLTVRLFSLAFDSEERIIVAGQSFGIASNSNVMTARFDESGTLDNTFGSFGQGFTLVDVAPNAFDIASSVVVDPEGRIVLVGSAQVSSSVRPTLVRLDSKGFLDKTFGDGPSGKLVLEVGNISNADSLALDSKGNILVAGIRRDGDGTLFALRVKSQGELDVDYGLNGGQFVEFGSNIDDLGVVSAFLDAHERLVIVGNRGLDTSNSQDVILTRIH